MSEHTKEADNTETAGGYSSQVDPHLSHEEARQELSNDSAESIQHFIDALAMQDPVSQATALALLEALLKETTTGGAGEIGNTMRMMEWEKLMSGGESLPLIAGRAADFLNTHPGLEVFNFFVKTLSKTSDSMY